MTGLGSTRFPSRSLKGLPERGSIGIYRGLGSTRFPASTSSFWAPLLRPNSRKKGTLTTGEPGPES